MSNFTVFPPCLRSAFGAIALMSLMAVGHAQTAEQLEIFQSLPPEQQRTILEALGRSQETMTTSPEPSRSTRDPDLVLPVTRDEEEIDEGPNARLRPYDTLLIELRLVENAGAERVLVKPPPTPNGPTGIPPTAPAPAQPAAQSTPPPANQSESRLKDERTALQRERLDKFREEVRKGNPFRLDANGFLELPGLRPIMLSGLTAYEAAQRLAAEPFLKDFAIDLIRLPVAHAGADGLKPFGYDLFRGIATTFAPASDIPVPAEYVLGPGDRVRVQLIGNTRGNYQLEVNRDGTINFPDLGPISVAGLRFDDARTMIEERVTQQMIGVRASVSLGELRSIRVFVLGESEQPGSYTVSGLSTITNALFVSGGVKPIGSLRDVQLKRGGRTVARLDLYDLLLRGDTSRDVRLQPGDAIFIPPVGVTVGLAGEVRRPAIYEVPRSATVEDLIALGGGLSPEADPRGARLERIDERRLRTTLAADLASAQVRSWTVQSGDTLIVPRVRPTLRDSVLLEGNVFRPGAYEFRPGMHLSDLIGSVEDLKPDSDLNYVLIRRERPYDRQVSAMSADLAAALAAPRTAADPQLAERDRVYVFDTTTGRDRIIVPIVDELQRQGTPQAPSSVVSIGGRAKVPGTYPLENGMKVSDLVRAGGGLDVSAYRNAAELTRYDIVAGEKREASVINVDLQRALAGDETANVQLKPFDVLVVKEVSEWSELEYVTLEGEFRFPGNYPIKRGETMRSVIARAGGLTELAFVEGSVFTRTGLKDREQRQLAVLSERLQRDLAALALQATQSSPQGATQAGEAIAIGQNLLADLKDTEAVGRLVIDLNGIMQEPMGSERDIVLRDGDRLAIPKRAQEVTVIGEVQTSTSHLFNSEWTREDYIAQSGGTTQKADDERIFVIRADGSVEADGGSRWFQRSNAAIRPGDTIVVPLDAERMRPLPLWTAVTTIIYNLAVAVAAVNSF